MPLTAVVIAVFPMEPGISDPFDLVNKLLHKGWSGECEGQTVRSPKNTFIFRVRYFSRA